MPRSKCASRSARHPLIFLQLWAATVLVFGLFGCADKSDHPAALPGVNDAGTRPEPTGNGCDTPNENCPCSTEAATAECGSVERVSGDYVSCTMGVRTCSGGKWGSCVGDRIATLHVPDSQRRTQALGAPTGCADNMDNFCDPYCRIQVDNSVGLPLPDGGPFTSDGGLQVVPHEDPSNLSNCTSMTVTPTPQTVTVTGYGTTGLTGEYFNQRDESQPQIPASWTPTGTRIDPNIDFNWDQNNPGITGVGHDMFSARWTGTITPPTGEPYVLCFETDDGGRVWIDDTLVADGWGQHGAAKACSAPLNWTAQSPHKIRVEYFDEILSASARLFWSTPSITQQVVPASAFSRASTQTVTVDKTPQFQIQLNPPGCFTGTPHPAWTLDRLDIAAIDATGTLSLLSAVAGPITVKAYLGQFTATGVANVNVNILNTDTAPSGSATKFTNAVASTDPARILYPYDKTVLPIGLRAPVVQWDPKGTAADAVKVSLLYPATGTPSFSWSEIIPEGTPAQATIPRQIWKFFEQTAKGQTATFALQRLIGLNPRPTTARTLQFSTAPVRGHIYYTQYHRNGVTNMMEADPGSENPAAPAFGATVDGCPVCHSMSANGNVFATSDRSFSGSLGGISQVNANGSLTPIADFIPDPTRGNYEINQQDWRGFAWAPLSPDGKYALVANNIWGNSREQVVGINAGSRTVSVADTLLSGGAGTGLLAKYFSSQNFTGTPWKRIEPQINFDFGAGSPGGLIATDFSVQRSGQIEANFSETYTFDVTTPDNVTLIIGGTTVFSGTGNQTGTIALTAGALTSFEFDEKNPSGNSSVQLYWRSASQPRVLVPQSQLFPNDGPHGAYVSYYPSTDFTGTPVSRLEPDIASNYLLNSPDPSIGADNWSSVWDATVEAPYTGNTKICVDTDDGVEVTVDGTKLASISMPLTAGGVENQCSTETLPWTAGSLHTVHLRHVEFSVAAKLVLSYSYGGITEVIPSANLTPVGYTAPTHGLTATYYDSSDFGTSIATTPTAPRAFQRIDPTVSFDWGSGRPNYSVITDDNNFSARFVGRIETACAGVFEFQSNGNIDDGGRMWIDDVRVMNRWSFGAMTGGTYLTAGLHEFKFDFREDGGNATVKLEWHTPCAGSTGFVPIPTSAFYPTQGAGQIGGFVRDGGDNGNDTSYWVWQTPTVAAPTPLDVTAATPGRWGLGSSVMMVPSFSPDGSKLVFIDGDSGGGAGWRKGLSTWDFNQASKLFSNRREIVSSWPMGDAMKWPTFESDSRSVIFQSTVPADMCCRNAWKLYGYMGPTNYYEDPGRLWSVDTQASPPAPVALTNLNSGENPKDANKSYQPTMLPTPAGGYRWVVYTSTRPYGNTLNLPAVEQDFSNTSSYTAMTNPYDIQSQLWVSAIDDQPSATTDRSHPGFWLPSQNFSTDASNGYINERGYWVLDACHPPGKADTSSCEVDEDCCGGSGGTKTAACRLDTPLTNPPTRHCVALPPVGQCAKASNSCGSTADCCAGLVCLNAACQTPPAVLTLSPQNYERIYQADCPSGTKPIWRFFDWKTVTPATNSKIEFFAESEADPSLFSTLPKAPNAVTSLAYPPVVSVGVVTGPPVTVWTGNEVNSLIQAAGFKSQQYLKITMRFTPNNEDTLSPIVTDWRQSYSCAPAE